MSNSCRKIIKDHSERNFVHMLHDVLQALQQTSLIFTSEDLAICSVALGEGHCQLASLLQSVGIIIIKELAKIYLCLSSWVFQR